MTEAQLHNVLSSLSINRITEFDGAKICLKLFPGGAVLSAELGAKSSPQALQTLLEQGFSWALLFDAGIAVDGSGNRVLLTHWLPNVHSWQAAEPALEQLLNQLDLCQSLLGSTTESPKVTSRSKEELRFRALLSR
ncbi:hypothetical protein [Actimicrobium antarcticum]|uniref:Uncharacterized protein n=1 Tax=Actimicrobium antarcticum TaxID=1051899 RepID=A0ABP7TGU5_9BURK